MSSSVATKLEKDKKKDIASLQAPDFRWTDTNDLISQWGTQRSKMNNRRGNKKEEVTCEDSIDRKGKARSVNEKSDSVVHSKRRVRFLLYVRQILTFPKRDSIDSEIGAYRAPNSPFSSSSSGSSPLTFAKTTNSDKDARTSSTPPVCWRLTQKEVARRRRSEESRRDGSGSDADPSDKTNARDVHYAWTLQEIEDAERELKEQGIELSGPFMVMLADLKAGELTKTDGETPTAKNVPTASTEGNTTTAKNERHISHTAPASPEQKPAPKHTDSPPDTPHDEKLPPKLPDYEKGLKSSAESPKVTKTESCSTPLKEDGDASKPRSKPQCVNCGATSTPLWRRDANFELQCNACGLYQKLHKMPRPRALKERRVERKCVKGSSDTSLSPKSSESKDEWLGIHAGSVCANCGTSTTPLWRKDREGRIICNACGLYYKLHSSHRPVTMRMDGIKRRSRYDDRRRAPTEGPGSYRTDANTPNNELSFDRSQFVPMTGLEGPHTPTEPPPAGLAAAFFMGNNNGMPVQQQSPFNSMMPNHSHTGLAMHHQALGSNLGVSQGSSSMLSSDGTIHIPHALWENQVCPMGAWGDDCCQNLPQPPPDIQSAVMAASDEQEPQMRNEPISASIAMDAILRSGDWMVDFAAATPGSNGNAQTPHHPHNSNHGMSNPSTPATGQNAAELHASEAQFNLSAVNGSPNQAVVGPSYPLKRRKVNTSASTPALGPHTPTMSASTIQHHHSSANTPTAEWWPFPPSPEAII